MNSIWLVRSLDESTKDSTAPPNAARSSWSISTNSLTVRYLSVSDFLVFVPSLSSYTGFYFVTKFWGKISQHELNEKLYFIFMEKI